MVVQSLDELRALQDLDHRFAFVGRVDHDRPRPLVELEELRRALHVALVDVVDLCTLQGHDEVAVDDHEQKVGVGLLVGHQRLVRQEPPRLKLPDDVLQELWRRIVDQVPDQRIALNGIQQHEVQSVGTGDAAELHILGGPSLVGAGLRLGLDSMARVHRRPGVRPEVCGAGVGVVLPHHGLRQDVHPILLRDPVRDEELPLGAVRDGLQEHMPVQDDHVHRAARPEHAREDDGHAEEGQVPDLRAAAEHGLRHRRRRGLRRVQVRPHLVGALLPMLRQQLVLLQDVEHLQAPRVVPRPPPVCGLLVAQVQAPVLRRRGELAPGPLDVRDLDQRGVHHLLVFLHNEVLPSFPLRLVGRRLRVAGPGAARQRRVRVRAPAVAEPRALARGHVLPRKALAAAALRH
mmetsp:Transcript_58887/g.170839  ORF Transcript_58887/g.170839 Transcript_58887/m.170839 type:complete len:404 (+) Transcript_58887:1295-2506(+)